jgi:hypothetical protein
MLVLAFTSCRAFPGACAAQPPAKPPGAAPKLVGTRALAKLVLDGKGKIPYAIRKTVRDEDDIFSVNWPNVPGGQHSTTLYSFGKSHLAPEKFATLIKFKPDLVLVNQGAGMWDSIPSVEMRATYPMREGRDPLTLVVTDLSPGYFTLADPSHRHAGSVTYGAFKDNTGELWLFEECVGEYFTSLSTFIGMHHKQMAEPTHKAILASIKAYIGDDTASDNGPCPAEFISNYVFGLNSRLDTEVTVKPGDKLTISASGLVTLGVFAGQGGPEGIQFNPAYSIFPNSPHGCLIGRIRTSSDEAAGQWAYIGKGDVWTIKDAGTLELDLNDNDQGNNTGEFRVEITVCRAH